MPVTFPIPDMLMVGAGDPDTCQDKIVGVPKGMLESDAVNEAIIGAWFCTTVCVVADTCREFADKFPAASVAATV